MNNVKFEIKPDYKLKQNIKMLIFLLGLTLFITPAFIKNESFYFFGLILMFIGLLLHLFISKEHLKVNQNSIEFESKSIINEFNKSISIPFDTIKEVNFFKRQFLIFGGQSIISPTLYFENRIVFIIENNRTETITQIGKLSDFKKAYSIIKSKVETTPPVQS
jgi:hypothetical protein